MQCVVELALDGGFGGTIEMGRERGESVRGDEGGVGR